MPPQVSHVRGTIQIVTHGDETVKSIPAATTKTDVWILCILRTMVENRYALTLHYVYTMCLLYYYVYSIMCLLYYYVYSIMCIIYYYVYITLHPYTIMCI
jgi:hypothetical protein